MRLTSWLSGLHHRLRWSSRFVKRGTRRRPELKAAALEKLEDRTLLAHLFLNGPSDSVTFTNEAVTYENVVLTNGASIIIVGAVHITADNISVDATSTITADAMGYGSASGAGAGECHQDNQGGAGGGAGYGGIGGRSSTGLAGGVSYGSITAPVDLGSGGGASEYGGPVPGGSGGGAIRLTVGVTLTLDGELTADGGDGQTQPARGAGGGSGGSIYVTAGTLAGADTGSISTDGGIGGINSGKHGGGGAGGRIAVYYTTNTFAGTLSSVGGSGDQYGGAGTIFTKSATQPNGSLVIDNSGHSGASTPLLDGTYTFDTVEVQNRGKWEIPSGAIMTVSDELAVTSNGQATVSGTLSGGDLTVQSGGQLTGSVDAGVVTLADVTVTDNGQLTMNAQMTAAQMMVSSGGVFSLNNSATITGGQIASGGQLTHTAAVSGFDLTVTGDLAVDSGGSIAADGMGHGSATGPGAGGSFDSVNLGSAGGAGYGGLGGSSSSAIAGGVTYGSITAPVDLGSGGGRWSNVQGGSGGGAIRFTVGGTLTVDGDVTADGEQGSTGNHRAGGGGSGGSIYVTTSALAGGGTISANGGEGPPSSSVRGGGGAGGRIAMYYDDASNFNLGNVNTNGGTGHQSGQSGSIHLVTPITNQSPTVEDQVFTAGENSPDGLSVGTVVASDPNPGDTLRYTITAGNTDVDGDTNPPFAIAEDTGEITVNDSGDLDRDQVADFPLTVDVADSEGRSDSATVTVFLSDANDVAPAITPEQNFPVDENSPTGTVVGAVAATDGDITPTTFQDWTITGGTGQGVFNVDPDSGEIAVIDGTQLDRETTAGFTLEITVSDAVHTSAVETVDIPLNDVNDVTPVIAAGQVFPINEASPNGTVVGTVEATDGDVTATTFQDWTITGGTGDPAFDIDPATGQITVVDSSMLIWGTTRRLMLDLTASDGVHTSAQQTVTIQDGTGPRIIAATPDLPVDVRVTSLDSVTVTFSEPVILDPGIAGAFTVDDVTIVGPDGGITPAGLTQLSDTEFELPFPAQTRRGTYTVSIGPDIGDLIGNMMDQDRDGNTAESMDDVFTFTVDAIDCDVVFTSDTTIAEDDFTYDGLSICVDGATVTIDGAHRFDVVHLIENAAVTHTAESSAGLNLSVTDEIIVDETSTIMVDGRGHNAASGPGAGGSASVGDGRGYGGGGGYGGVGGRSWVGTESTVVPGGPAYGSIIDPTDLGSGGGTATGYWSVGVGGSGGGVIQLNIDGTLTVDGSVTADGADGQDGGITAGGGGSGGSIHVTAGTLAGTGLISADGGDGGTSAHVHRQGGGGAGGRIAVYCGNQTFTGDFSAGGGSGYEHAGAGTVFTKSSAQASGSLIVDNLGNSGAETPLLESSHTFDAVEVRNAADLAIPTGVVLTAGDISVRDGAKTVITGTLEGGDVAVLAGGELTAASGAPAVVVADVTVDTDGRVLMDAELTAQQILLASGGTLILNNSATASGVQIASGGVLTHSAGQVGFNLDVAGDVTIDPGGTIMADGQGHSAASGPGAGGSASVGDGRGYGGGGGYGGVGGRSWVGTESTVVPGGPAYGSIIDPTDLGSGGGTATGYWSVGVGGSGGGVIQLNIDGTLTVDGSVTADGADGQDGGITAGGGGSGGSIHVTAGTLAGTGLISADGGDGGTSAHVHRQGGGGAGGRIAVYYYDSYNFGGSITTVRGYGYELGGSGTQYTAQTIRDDDGDGVADEVEDAAPNGGDGNSDGLPDSQQGNVNSLLNAVDAGYVTLASPDVTALKATAIANPSPADAPANVEFPVGFFDYRVEGLAAGGSTTATFYLAPGLRANAYYKFGATADNPAPHWYRFPSSGPTRAEFFDDDTDGFTDRVVVQFVDGDDGDDDLIQNGTVVDPGAPAFENTPPTVTTNTGLTVDQASANNTIGQSVLNTTDAEQTAAELTYTLDITVTKGTMWIDADSSGTINGAEAALADGGTFTQQDIDDGTLKYTHDGDDAVADSFQFDVSDGIDSVDDRTFTITITPAETAVTLVGDTLTITDVNGGTSTDDLSISFAGGVYTITDAGGLKINASSVAGSTGSATASVTVPQGTIDSIDVGTLAGDDAIAINSTDTGVGVTIDGGDDADAVNWDSTAALVSLDVTAETINMTSGAVTTTGDQTYDGAVVLDNVTTLTGGDVTFNGSLDSVGPVTYSYSAPPAIQPDVTYGYEDSGLELVNGIYGTGGYHDPEWVGFDNHSDNGEPHPGIIFDFNGLRALDELTLNYLWSPAGGVHAPDSVEISFSTDGVSFGGMETFTGLPGVNAVENVVLDFADQQATHVKLDIFNDMQWTFLGEVDFGGGSGLMINASGDVAFNGIVGGQGAPASIEVNSTGSTVDINAAINVGAGGLDIDAPDTITVDASINSAGGDVSMTATGDIRISDAVDSGGGNLTVDADADNDGTGNFTTNDAGSAVSTADGAVSVTADDWVLLGTIDAGSGTVTFLRSGVNQPIVLAPNENVTDAIEDDGEWTLGTTDIQYVDAAGGIYGITPTAGTEMFHFNNNGQPYAGTNFIVFETLPLAVGTYTASVDVGDFNNNPFATIGPVGLTVAGTQPGTVGTLLTPTSSSTPTPASGTWETWTYSYEILPGDPNLGSNVGFSINVPFTGTTANVAFDNLVLTAPAGGLSDAELDNVTTTAKIVVGDATAGDVTFEGAISMASADTLEIISGSDITETVAGNAVSGDTLVLKGDLAPGLAGTGTFDVDGPVTFDATASFELNLNGTGDYDQLTVAGDGRTITLNNAELVIALDTVPAVGSQDVFTIVDAVNDNSTRTGLFNYGGVPQNNGDEITVGGTELTINYLADGDVILTESGNQPPVIAVDLAEVTTPEGTDATNTGTFSDPQGNSTVTITADMGDVTQDDGAGTWSWSIPTTDGPDGPFTVTITATDDIGAWDDVSFTYTVDNVAPTVTVDIDPVIVDEGQTATNGITVTDPGEDGVALAASIGQVSQGGLGGALEFDGVDGYVQTSSLPLSGLSAMTIETWVNPDNANTFDIFRQTDRSPYRSDVVLYSLSLSPMLDIWLPTGGARSRGIADGTLTVGQWNHVAAVFDGSGATDADRLKFYINGVPQSVTFSLDPVPGQTGIFDVPSYIGSREGGQPFLDGQLDDLRIWNTARTATEIQNEMANALTGDEAGLVAYYPFDDGTGSTTAADATGNGYTGTLVNMDVNTSWVSSDVPGGQPIWSFDTDDGDSESQTVTITADDGDPTNNIGTAQFELVVNNVAPTATFTNDGPVDEGGTANVTFSDQADPSTADTDAGFHYAYDLDNNGLFDDGAGDGTYAGSVTATSAAVPAALLADGPDTLTVKGRILDKDGGLNDYTTTITINNVAPTVTVDTDPVIVNEGETAENIVNYFDPGLDDVTVTASIGTLTEQSGSGGTPGVFLDSGQELGSSYSRNVGLGDLDGDGDLDAYVVSWAGEARKVWVNDGSGAFTDSGQNLGASYSLGVKLGDLDGDGDLDAFVTDYYQGSEVWLNDGSGSFTDSGQSLGSSTRRVALGDLDGDGDLDAFVTTDVEGNKVWLNDGSGFFSPIGQSLGISNSSGVDLGDLDGDGDLDAFVAKWRQPNTVWLNNGSGFFTDNGQALGTADSRRVRLGDLDGDGDLDAFVTNGTGQANKVWVNDGSGAFTDSGQTLGTSNSGGLSLGDVDGDGDLDAFVGNFYQPNTVWLNDGGGNLSDSGQAMGSSVSRSAALGDLDGDGDLDAFVPNDGQPDTVWLNQTDPVAGDYLWSFDTDDGTAESQTVTITADDGDPTNNIGTAQFELVVNNVAPTATFTNDGPVDEGGAANVTFSDQADPSNADTAAGFHYAYDFDNDGVFDMGDGTYAGSVTDASAAVPAALLADGPDTLTVKGRILDKDGGLTDYTTTITINNVAPTVTVDTDPVEVDEGQTAENIINYFDPGLDDVTITASIGTLTEQSVSGGTPGVFLDSGQALGSSASFGMSLGDLDGDGDLDAFVANSNTQPNLVWLNDGSGTFTDSGQSLGSSSSLGVDLGDVDGDGDLDAFVANSTANKVWLNDGSGNFTDSSQSLGNLNSWDVRLGDLDGDGDLDAFVVNWDTTPDKVYLNDGSGTFTVSQSLASSRSLALSLGDLDGDGDLDAFVANGNSQANRVWLNDGSGTFTHDQSLGSSTSLSVDLGDVDGDGDLDAFVANAVAGGGAQSNKVWLNDGSGTLTDSGQSLGDLESWEVNLGDVDGDGDLDAFVANARSGNEANKVWLNDGSGTLTDSGQNLGDSPSYGARLGDLDGDGDLDAFVANRSQPDTVWLNQTDPVAGDYLWSFDTDDGTAESQTVTITADDGDPTNNIGTAQFELIVNNVAPTATFDNDGPVDEGGAANVIFSDQADPSNADTAAGFHYAYDFDNDGNFDMGDGTYAGSVTDASAAVPAALLADGPATLEVKGRILDKDGGLNDYTTTITIDNVAPSVTVDIDPVIVDEGETATNGITVTDPGQDELTVTASVGTIGEGGVLGGALEFDGDDDFAYTTLSNTLTEVTMEAWIRADDVDASENRVIMCNGGGNVEEVQVWVSNGHVHAARWLGNGGIASAPIESGTWYHIAAAITGESITLYVNGDMVDSHFGPGTADPSRWPWPYGYIQSHFSNWTIGERRNGEQNMEFDGTIDEVRVWDTALDETTIASWMNRELDATHPAYGNLEGYWQFNEGSGTTAADTSGYGNDATLHNMDVNNAWLSPAWSFDTDDGDSESQTVTITADDGDPTNNIGTAQFELIVNNVAPTATFANDGPVDEGGAANVTFSDQSDPSTADCSRVPLRLRPGQQRLVRRRGGRRHLRRFDHQFVSDGGGQLSGRTGNSHRCGPDHRQGRWLHRLHDRHHGQRPADL